MQSCTYLGCTELTQPAWRSSKQFVRRDPTNVTFKCRVGQAKADMHMPHVPHMPQVTRRDVLENSVYASLGTCIVHLGWSRSASAAEGEAEVAGTSASASLTGNKQVPA